MKITKTNLMSLIIGLVIGTSVPKMIGPPYGSTRMFERGDQPSVMRTYRFGKDRLFVENPDTNGLYNIPLKKYLENTFSNKYDRDVERAEIEKLVFDSEQ